MNFLETFVNFYAGKWTYSGYNDIVVKSIMLNSPCIVVTFRVSVVIVGFVSSVFFIIFLLIDRLFY